MFEQNKAVTIKASAVTKSIFSSLGFQARVCVNEVQSWIHTCNMPVLIPLMQTSKMHPTLGSVGEPNSNNVRRLQTWL